MLEVLLQNVFLPQEVFETFQENVQFDEDGNKIKKKKKKKKKGKKGTT